LLLSTFVFVQQRAFNLLIRDTANMISILAFLTTQSIY